MTYYLKTTDKVNNPIVHRYVKRERDPNEAAPNSINVMKLPSLTARDMPQMVATRPGSTVAFTLPSKGSCRNRAA